VSGLEDLRRCGAELVRAQASIDDQVLRLVRMGANWQHIGDALGISRQAARQRYLRALKPR
jgi:hypothetical protein